MKNLKKGLILLIACLFFVGCSTNQQADNGQQPSNEDGKDNQVELSGSLSLAGSTSMEKLCEALMEGFMEKYPKITVTTEYSGSGAGIESLTKGTVAIGNASRNLKDGETSKGAVQNTVAIDGIGVIVNKDTGVANVTKDQLISIYTGQIVNWKELGGNDEPIVVIGRENGSGTRSAFEELLKIEDQCAYAQEIDTTGGVLAKVASIQGAIGYVSLNVIDQSVTALSINDVEATEKNIKEGSYVLARPFVMATMGKIDEQNEIVKLWFDYISSSEGQEIIQSIGLILPN